MKFSKARKSSGLKMPTYHCSPSFIEAREFNLLNTLKIMIVAINRNDKPNKVIKII